MVNRKPKEYGLVGYLDEQTGGQKPFGNGSWNPNQFAPVGTGNKKKGRR